jgi:hypothetical protein
MADDTLDKISVAAAKALVRHDRMTTEIFRSIDLMACSVTSPSGPCTVCSRYEPSLVNRQ